MFDKINHWNHVTLDILFWKIFKNIINKFCLQMYSYSDFPFLLVSIFFVWVFLKFVHFIENFEFVAIEMSLFYRYPLSVGFVMIIFCHFLILVLIFTSVHVFFFCFNSLARSLSILLMFSNKQALSLSFSLLSVLYFIGFCSFYFLFSSFGFTLLLFF